MIKTLCLGIFYISVNTVMSQESFSLTEAKKAAVENSASVKSAQIDVDIANRKVWETKAIGLPQINAEAGFQQFIDIPTQVIPAKAFNPFASENEMMEVQFGTEYTASANLTVSQLLFDGRYLIGLKAVQMFTQVSQQSLVKSEKIAKEEVEDAYYMVVVSREQVVILVKTKDKLQKLMTDIQILADEKVLEQTEADQIALNFKRLENSLVLARKQNELATDLLKLKMGFNLEKQIEASDSLSTFIDVFDPGKYLNLQFDAAKNIDVQLLETQLALDALNIKNEQAAGIPSLAAFFQTQQQAYRNEFNFFSNRPWYPANIWGINLNLPIFSSGQRNAKVKQAELSRDKTELLIGSVEEGLRLQVKNVKVNLKASWDLMQSNKQGMIIAERILNSGQIKFKEGIISSTDFTQIENQFIQAQSDYINSAYQMLKSKLELDKLTVNE
ncbi:MAG: TolC family protein [Flavobacteriales bacterium]|nr:TolC family protein [Flavobacteriales bacterium]